MDSDSIDIEGLIDALIDREGGFANHPADRGRPTCFGITEAVARAHGYGGAMRDLPRSARIAAELFDTGVSMGPAVAATFLQRALTAQPQRQGFRQLYT